MVKVHDTNLCLLPSGSFYINGVISLQDAWGMWPCRLLMWQVSPASLIFAFYASWMTRLSFSFPLSAIEPSQCDKIPRIFYWGQWAEHSTGASRCWRPLSYDQGKKVFTAAARLRQQEEQLICEIFWTFSPGAVKDTGCVVLQMQQKSCSFIFHEGVMVPALIVCSFWVFKRLYSTRVTNTASALHGVFYN